MLDQLLFNQTREIALPGGEALELRALTLGDLAGLLAKFPEQMTALQSGGMAELPAVAAGFTAAVIACAAGEPDQAAAAARLPAGVQIAALNAVWELSAVDDAVLGEFLGRLLRTMNQATAALSGAGWQT